MEAGKGDILHLRWLVEEAQHALEDEWVRGLETSN
jgi:hypothetical protein